MQRLTEHFLISLLCQRHNLNVANTGDVQTEWSPDMTAVRFTFLLTGKISLWLPVASSFVELAEQHAWQYLAGMPSPSNERH